MTGCGYPSMEQCQAVCAGIGGNCFRDPWLTNKAGSNPAGAYAYAPKAPQAAKATKRGRTNGNAAAGAQ